MGRTGLAVALAVTAAVAGCGDSDSSDEPSGSAQGVSGEEQRVAQVIEDFEQAAKDGDNARICDEIFAERDRPENCEADVGSFLQATENREVDLVVEGVKVDGTAAEARLAVKQAGETRTTTYSLIEEDGEWRIASMED
jgi:hypothetical protein